MNKTTAKTKGREKAGSFLKFFFFHIFIFLDLKFYLIK